MDDGSWRRLHRAVAVGLMLSGMVAAVGLWWAMGRARARAIAEREAARRYAVVEMLPSEPPEAAGWCKFSFRLTPHPGTGNPQWFCLRMYCVNQELGQPPATSQTGKSEVHGLAKAEPIDIDVSIRPPDGENLGMACIWNCRSGIACFGHGSLEEPVVIARNPSWAATTAWGLESNQGPKLEAKLGETVVLVKARPAMREVHGERIGADEVRFCLEFTLEDPPADATKPRLSHKLE